MSTTSSAAPSSSSSSMSPEQQAMAAMAAEASRVLHISQVYYAAVIAVVIWDWVLNLQREYQLIWKAKWSVGKVSYILARYITTVVAMIIVTIGTFANFSPSACSKFVKVDALLAVLVTMCCETVLGLRTWSIWNRNKWLSVYLLMHWLAVLVILLVNVGIAVTYVPIIGASGPCIPTGGKLFISFWVAIISYELATTALMTIRSVQIMRQTSFSSTGFLKLLMRDGILYAIIVCSLNIINIGFILQNDNPMIKGVNAAPTTYLTAVACCHLVLSLLQAGSPSDSYLNSGSHALPSAERSSTSSIMRQIPHVRRNASGATHHRHSGIRDEFDNSKTSSLEDQKHDGSTPDFSTIRVNTEVEVHSECDTKSIV